MSDDPHASRRDAVAKIMERRAQRRHRQNNIAQGLQQPVGALIGLIASLAPGPAGIALRAILSAYDGLKERKALEENRALRAQVLSLRKAVDELTAIAAEAEAEHNPPSVAEPASEPVPPPVPIPAPEPAKPAEPAPPPPSGALAELLARLKPPEPQA